LRIRSSTALMVAVVVLAGTATAAATACPGGGAGGTRVNVLSAAASYLGVTVDQLETDLKSGKTLAQLVAATTGKTVAGLKAAIQAAAKTQLDQAVAAGTITSAQEQTALDQLNANLDGIVNGTSPTGFGLRAATRGTFAPSVHAGVHRRRSSPRRRRRGLLAGAAPSPHQVPHQVR
jgi:hypothetical protein